MKLGFKVKQICAKIIYRVIIAPYTSDHV